MPYPVSVDRGIYNGVPLRERIAQVCVNNPNCEYTLPVRSGDGAVDITIYTRNRPEVLQRVLSRWFPDLRVVCTPGYPEAYLSRTARNEENLTALVSALVFVSMWCHNKIDFSNYDHGE